MIAVSMSKSKAGLIWLTITLPIAASTIFLVHLTQSPEDVLFLFCAALVLIIGGLTKVGSS